MVRAHEHFLPYDEFPWFKDATVSSILDVKLLGHSHLHWPQLDIDLHTDSIENPKGYPLFYRN